MTTDLLTVLAKHDMPMHARDLAHYMKGFGVKPKRPMVKLRKVHGYSARGIMLEAEEMIYVRE